MEGEIGDLSEKMERELSREGSLNVGASLGLVGKIVTCGSEETGIGEGGGDAEEEGRAG